MYIQIYLLTKKNFSIVMITYYRFNRLIFYSISPFLLWLSIFSDYLSISLSLLFSQFFFFSSLGCFWLGWIFTGFKVVVWIGWVSEVAWISVGFKGGLNRLVSILVLKLNRWLGFKGGLNQHCGLNQHGLLNRSGLLNRWWVFESVLVAGSCLNRWEWRNHGDQIGGCVFLGF